MQYGTWPTDHSPRNGARYSSRTPPEPEAQTTALSESYRETFYMFPTVIHISPDSLWKMATESSPDSSR